MYLSVALQVSAHPIGDPLFNKTRFSGDDWYRFSSFHKPGLVVKFIAPKREFG